MNRIKLIIAAIAFIFFLNVVASAAAPLTSFLTCQYGTAQLYGNVNNGTGGIPNATITTTNSDNTVCGVATTNSFGNYFIDLLYHTGYIVRVSAKGYSSYVQYHSILAPTELNVTLTEQ